MPPLLVDVCMNMDLPIESCREGGVERTGPGGTGMCSLLWRTALLRRCCLSSSIVLCDVIALHHTINCWHVSLCILVCYMMVESSLGENENCNTIIYFTFTYVFVFCQFKGTFYKVMRMAYLMFVSHFHMFLWFRLKTTRWQRSTFSEAAVFKVSMEQL